VKNHALLVLMASAGLSGCTLTSLRNEPIARQVQVGGQSYVLKQLTDSTWTASAAAGLTALPATSASTAALRQAVETTSGCKVTDSDYSRQGQQFDAQVSCESALSN
jgi:hypothetical protein